MPRQQINFYIETHIQTANLDELTNELGCPAVYTGSLVKKMLGNSFSVHLQNRRCSIAAQRLLHTDLTIKEMIDEVGYRNESFFRNLFKKIRENSRRTQKAGTIL